MIKAATVPMPEQYFADLLQKVDKVIVIEELDSVIEKICIIYWQGQE